MYPPLSYGWTHRSTLTLHWRHRLVVVGRVVWRERINERPRPGEENQRKKTRTEVGTCVLIAELCVRNECSLCNLLFFPQVLVYLLTANWIYHHHLAQCGVKGILLQIDEKFVYTCNAYEIKSPESAFIWPPRWQQSVPESPPDPSALHGRTWDTAQKME